SETEVLAARAVDRQDAPVEDAGDARLVHLDIEGADEEIDAVDADERGVRDAEKHARVRGGRSGRRDRAEREVDAARGDADRTRRHGVVSGVEAAADAGPERGARDRQLERVLARQAGAGDLRLQEPERPG